MNRNVDQAVAAVLMDPGVPATVAAAVTALAEAVRELGWAQQNLEWTQMDQEAS